MSHVFLPYVALLVLRRRTVGFTNQSCIFRDRASKPSTFLSVCTRTSPVCACQTGSGSGARPRASSDDVFFPLPSKRVAESAAAAKAGITAICLTKPVEYEGDVPSLVFPSRGIDRTTCCASIYTYHYVRKSKQSLFIRFKNPTVVKFPDRYV